MITKFQTYQKYNDSGVGWFPTMPSGWDINRGKFLFRNRKKINKTMSCDNVLSLTMNGVLHRDELGEGGLLPTSYETFQLFEKDNLVFKLIDLENYKTSRVGIVPEKGIMSSAYIRLEAKNQDIAPRYFYWLYFNLYLQGIYNFLGMGVRSTLNAWDLLGLPLLIPELETQKRIADFLDKKTKIIDALIAKKEKLIELLREKRIALVTHTVTKGLDPHAKPKPSGVEWLGDIPEGWEKLPLKFLFAYQSGGVWGDEERYDEHDIICIRVADFDFLRFTTYSSEYTLRNLPKIKPELVLNEASILLEKSGGGDQQPVGRAVRYVGKEKATCSNFVQKLQTNKKYNPDFIVLLLSSLYFMGVTKKAVKQTTGIQNLDLGFFLRTNIFLPSSKEQQEIIQYLNTESGSIIDAIEKIDSQIEKLKEYRSSLIYSAVTGKIKI